MDSSTNYDLDVDKIIEKLLEVRGSKPGKLVKLDEEDILALCAAAKKIFLSQSIFLKLDAPLKICGIRFPFYNPRSLGNLHGQYYDLLNIFEHAGFPPEENYLFLGDYVDRGKQSIETICLLFAYKVKYRENFFLLRGHHECAPINRMLGFYDECKRRYNVKLWKVFSDVFNCLPVAALVEDKIFCVHGGLSPELTDLGQILAIKRPIEVPEQGLLCDLLWSDPDSHAKGWSENERGASYTFGREIVDDFVKKHDLKLICRAHQIVEDGYEFFADKKLVTLYSAPNDCGEHDNGAGVMTVDEDLEYTFSVLKPQKK